jgi:monovalent cation/proton antiporter MnhG/PhaG subunit
VGERPDLRPIPREAHLSDLAVDALLVLGVGAQLVCCLGLLVMRTAADRLHYASAACTVGPFCVLAAVLIREGLTSAGLDSIAAVGLLFLAGPIVVHAIARADRRSALGDVQPRPEERA